MAELERRHGKRSMDWTYHDALGNPVGMVVRWDLAGDKKDIRPVARHGNGWRLGAMPAPRPLYGLPDLLATKGRIYVVEGEKAAGAGRSIGLLTTTSPGGAQAAGQADWGPLAGGDVVALPDNDKPGEKYIADATARLHALAMPAKLKIVRLPGLPPGGDLADYLQARQAAGLDAAAIRAEIERLVAAVDEEKPDPAVVAVQPYRPFPVELIPEPVQGFIRAAAAAIGCDPAFVVMPTLAALASAIGNTRRIQLKRSWQEPCILWTVIVAQSGEKKSPPLDAALNPLYKRQHEAFKRFALEMQEYKKNLRDYKRALAKWEKGKGDSEPVEPEAPVCERCWIDDTTVEAVLPLLALQWRGLLMKRDELSAWFGSFDKYTKGNKRSSDAAKWCEMFGARPIVNDRKTSGTLYVPRAALCATGGIQPQILKRAMGREHFESGLSARLLMAMPPAKARRWSEAGIDQRLQDALHEVYANLFALQPGYDENGDPVPIDLPLTPEAKRAWIGFYNAHADEQAELTGDLSACWSKLEGYAARLSLVVHLVRCAVGNADPHAVDAASIAAGVSLSRWFGQEAMRIYAILAESDEEQEQRELAELIRRKGGQATVRDLQRWRDRQYPTAMDAETALKGLVNARLGRWQMDIHGAAGGRPVMRFILAPDTDTTSVKPEKNKGSVSVSDSQQNENGWGEV